MLAKTTFAAYNNIQWLADLGFVIPGSEAMGISDKIVAVVLNQMPPHAEHYQTESKFDGTVARCSLEAEKRPEPSEQILKDDHCPAV